jgi:hypothetical protein
MKRSELVRLVKEMLDEANVTSSGGASFTPGTGAQYATPAAFSKTPSKRAKKTLTKQGYKQVSRPKRPSHTKAFDYL